MRLTRRNILTLGAAGLSVAALSRIAPALLPARDFEFTPVARPEGFRSIARTDGLSAGRLFVGLDGNAPKLPQLSDADMCTLLTGGSPAEQSQVSIAVFSDFFCPYCRVLDLQVRDIAQSDPKVRVIPHEVPLLGVPSQFAARAVIAAEMQGAYDAFHTRLIRTNFVPNPAYLRSIAETEGLNVAQFSSDMQSKETNQRLAESAALFRALGFVGTPALVVGRTLVNGVITPRDLRDLIALELAEGPPAGCA